MKSAFCHLLVLGAVAVSAAAGLSCAAENTACAEAERLMRSDLHGMAAMPAYTEALQVLLRRSGKEIPAASLIQWADAISWDMQRGYTLKVLAEEGVALTPEQSAWLLEFGAHYGYPDVVKLALAAGASPNHYAIDYFLHEGENVLCRALRGFECHYDGDTLATARALLEGGADPNACNKANGFAPLLAASSAQEVALLLSYGADANATDLNGRNLLQRRYRIWICGGAAQEALVKVLAEHQFNFNHTDAAGKTLLDYFLVIYKQEQENPHYSRTMFAEDTALLELLRSYGAKTAEELKKS